MPEPTRSWVVVTVLPCPGELGELGGGWPVLVPVAVAVVSPKVLVVTTPEGGGCCWFTFVVVVVAVLVFLETVETVLVLVTGAGTGATPVDEVVEVLVTALVVDTPPVRPGWFGGAPNPEVTLFVDVNVLVLVAPAIVCPVVPVVAVLVF